MGRDWLKVVMMMRVATCSIVLETVVMEVAEAGNQGQTETGDRGLTDKQTQGIGEYGNRGRYRDWRGH